MESLVSLAICSSPLETQVMHKVQRRGLGQGKFWFYSSWPILVRRTSEIVKHATLPWSMLRSAQQANSTCATPSKKHAQSYPISWVIVAIHPAHPYGSCSTFFQCSVCIVQEWAIVQTSECLYYAWYGVDIAMSFEGWSWLPKVLEFGSCSCIIMMHLKLSKAEFICRRIFLSSCWLPQISCSVLLEWFSPI